jgi:hypothetical protein
MLIIVFTNNENKSSTTKKRKLNESFLQDMDWTIC